MLTRKPLPPAASNGMVLVLTREGLRPAASNRVVLTLNTDETSLMPPMGRSGNMNPLRAIMSAVSDGCNAWLL